MARAIKETTEGAAVFSSVGSQELTWVGSVQDVNQVLSSVKNRVTWSLEPWGESFLGRKESSLHLLKKYFSNLHMAILTVSAVL